MEDGEPFRDRLRGDAAVVRDGGDVENGSDASYKKLEECCEKCGIFDLKKLVDIALHICADVAGKEHVGLCSASDNARVAADFMQYGKLTSRIT